MEQVRLGVRLDHVASLRQIQAKDHPSLVTAADLCLRAGAFQISLHLRGDRCHVQDTDIDTMKLSCRKFGRQFCLEVGMHEDILDVALATAPDRIVFVPELVSEKTGAGGMKLHDDAIYVRIRQCMTVLRQKIPSVRLGILIDADISIVDKVVSLDPDIIEIHTGAYAEAFDHGEDVQEWLEKFASIKNCFAERSVELHGGHGLSIEGVKPLLDAGLFTHYNIGHWIVAQSIFDGLDKVVSELKKIFGVYVF